MRVQSTKRLPYLERRCVEVLKPAEGGGDDVLDLVWVLPEVHAKITWSMSGFGVQHQHLTTNMLVYQ